MSSGVIAGKFDKELMLESKDREGITFKEALEDSGYMGEITNRLNAKDYMALVELHVEQGPVLEAEKKDIGIVEGVVGMVNYEFTITGQADHAGTTPMKYRKDALFAACNIIRYLYDELDKLDSKLVYTTGRMNVSPNIHTVIPDLVKFTLDVRHQDPTVINQAIEIIKRVPEEVDRCSVSYKELWSRKTVAFCKEFIDFVEKNANEYGYSSMRMYSGPGHDAQFIADMIPATMIFVPSQNGHSHWELMYYYKLF